MVSNPITLQGVMVCEVPPTSDIGAGIVLILILAGALGGSLGVAVAILGLDGVAEGVIDRAPEGDVLSQMIHGISTKQ